MKRSDLLTQMTTWVNVKSIMPSRKVRYTRLQYYYIYIYYNIITFIFNSEKNKETESKSVVVRDWGKKKWTGYKDPWSNWGDGNIPCLDRGGGTWLYTFAKTQ